MFVYFNCVVFLTSVMFTKSDDYFNDYDFFRGLTNQSFNGIDQHGYSYQGDNKYGHNHKPIYVDFGTSSTLLREIRFQREIGHFGQERIPERVVHARGSAAFGYFKMTNPDISQYSKASVFANVGKQTPVAIRFSTATGESGEADTVFGDMRGFAVKFYTEEGNWDIVGNNVPMFPVRDPQEFTSFIHANKRNPQTGLRDFNSVWDFISLRPETLNLVTYLFGPFLIPNGFRHMPGFSINAYKFVNQNNHIIYVKFHLIPTEGEDYLDVETAAYLRGVDPDYARRDLFTAITAGNYPSWILKVQLMTEEQVKDLEFYAFDATKFWPEDRFPLIEVGIITLDTNPTNFFAQTEQIAFCPSNLVPGIEPSPDKLLHGRLFSYGDTQRYRLGANHHLIPVNRPVDLVITPTQRDGKMRVDGNFGNLPNYYPNSLSTVTDDPEYLEPKFLLNKSFAFRWDTQFDQNYLQARQVYYSFPDSYREVLHRNLAIAMKNVYQFIIERMIKQLNIIDPNYGESVRTEIDKIRSEYHSKH